MKNYSEFCKNVKVTVSIIKSFAFSVIDLSYWSTQWMLISEKLLALLDSIPYALSLNYEHMEVSTILQSK